MIDWQTAAHASVGPMALNEKSTLQHHKRYFGGTDLGAAK